MATKPEPHGKNWRGVYWDTQGRKRKTATVSSKRKAEQLANDAQAEIRRGTWVDPQAGAITLSDYFENHWLPARQQGEVNTMAKHRIHYRAKRFGLRVALGHVQLRHLRQSDVQRWVNAMVADGMSPPTIEGRFDTLRSILDGQRRGASARRDGLIQISPCLDIERPLRRRRPPVAFTAEEVAKIRAAMSPWWEPVVAMAVETGLRWGELLGLRVCDLELPATGPMRTLEQPFTAVLVRQTIIVDSAEHGIGGTPMNIKHFPKEGPREFDKRIELIEETQAWLGALVLSRGLRGEDLLFTMPDKTGGRRDTRRGATLGKQPGALDEERWTPMRTDAWPQGLPIAGSYFRQFIWDRALTEAGVRRLPFKTLRASFITWQLANNAPTALVMQRAGHSNITTTQRYIGTIDQRDALEALRRAVRGGNSATA